MSEDASTSPWREQLQAVLLSALCSVLFLGEALWPGRALVPYPPEVIEPLRSEALADGRVALADLQRGNPAFGDKYHQSLCWDRITQEGLGEGRWPLWTRRIGGGAPFVPQMGQVYQPWNLLLWLWPSTAIYGPWFLLHQVVFGWLAYRFLRRIRCSHGAALLGVVAAVLGLWTQARVHHNVILTAALPAFAMLSSVHRLFAGAGARAAGWLALGTGLSWLGGLPQASLYLTYVTAGYAVALAGRAPKGRRLRPGLWTAAGLAVGGLLSLAQMGPVLLAAADSARRAGTALDLIERSLDLPHLLALVWPDLLGWPAEALYGQELEVRAPWTALLLLPYEAVLRFSTHGYPEAACAVGIAPLVLAVAALGRRQLEVAFFAAVAVLGWWMACVGWPMAALSALLPGGRSGDPRRALLLSALALPVLAALGFDRVRTGRATVSVWLCAAIAAASAALLAMHLRPATDLADLFAPRLARAAAAALPNADLTRLEQGVRAAMLPGEAEANRAHLLATFARGALAAGGALVLLCLRRRRGAALALCALTALELAHAGRGPVLGVARQRVEAPPRILLPAIESTRAATAARPRFQRLADAGDPRKGALLAPNLAAFWGLEDAAAYNPLPPQRFEELFVAIEPDEPGKPSVALGGAGVDAFRRVESLTHPLLDVLGVRWVLAARTVDAPGTADRTPAGTAGPFRLYERTTCLPRATFVTRAEVVADRGARLARLRDPTRDAAGSVLLQDEGAPRPPPATGPTAVVELAAHEDERAVVRVRNASAGYLRLADPYDPGWCATVDGAPARLWLADHALRAVWLEPGEHEVVFAYRAAAVVWPRRLALLGLLAALALLAAPRRRADPGPTASECRGGPA